MSVKSPFKRRADGPGTPSTSSFQPLQQVRSHEVINIGPYERNGSDGDFREFTSQLPRPEDENSVPTLPLQLELDLRSDPEDLSNWFSSNFPRGDLSPHLLNQQPKGAGPSVQDKSERFLTGEQVLADNVSSTAASVVINSLETMNVCFQSY